MDDVSAAQAAALTGFSERTIRRKIASGELPARRIAVNCYAIRVRDLPVSARGADNAHRVEALEQRVQLLEQAVAHLGGLLPGQSRSPHAGEEVVQNRSEHAP
jgi:hypothetical protein